MVAWGWFAGDPIRYATAACTALCGEERTKQWSRSLACWLVDTWHHQSSNYNRDPFNPVPRAADSAPFQHGHQDCLPLRSLEDPFVQCSWDLASIQLFSGWIYNSVTQSPPYSCNEFSSLNPISNLDSSAGIPALKLHPVPNSSGTRTLPSLCFYPNLEFGVSPWHPPHQISPPMLPTSLPPWILIYICWINKWLAAICKALKDQVSTLRAQYFAKHINLII